MSGIIWIIVVGFVAGIIARMLSPGPNNPSGFILTTILGIAGAFLATWIGQMIGYYGTGPNSGRRLHHRDDRRTDRAVHLEPAGRTRHDSGSGIIVTAFEVRHARGRACSATSGIIESRAEVVGCPGHASRA